MHPIQVSEAGSLASLKPMPPGGPICRMGGSDNSVLQLAKVDGIVSKELLARESQIIFIIYKQYEHPRSPPPPTHEVLREPQIPHYHFPHPPQRNQAHLDLGVETAQAAADTALQHGVIVVVGIAQGLLKALQGLLEEAEAQESIAHAQADLTPKLGTSPGARQAEAGLAVGDGFVELT